MSDVTTRNIQKKKKKCFNGCLPTSSIQKNYVLIAQVFFGNIPDT